MTNEDHPRDTFPRGMAQPESGFRFSVDALLLACFASRFSKSPKPLFVLDLGAGCGVVGLGWLLREKGSHSLLGVDIDQEMTGLAQINAKSLGLEQQCHWLTQDIRRIRDATSIHPESFSLALANPPYWQPGHGREPQEAATRQARFETSASLEDFLAAAFYALNNRASLCLVYDAERMADLTVALRNERLEPKRMRLVHSRNNQTATLVLVEAMKNGKPGCRIEPPLALYEGLGKKTRLTAQALDFCPFLACNPGPGAALSPPD
ncbi:MAG: methyltransferase domain-containing protein [Desulfovibrio sp.]|nr:MAG: methyltransferase domain-containing protein [Desulfovibrio sp.]